MQSRKMRSQLKSPPRQKLSPLRFQSRREWLLAGLLVGITVVTFSLVFACDFVSYDDPLHVTANPRVQTGLAWQNLVWGLTELNGNWHPLTWWSYMLDVELFGLSPAGFHLMNLLWHVGSVLLLFFTLHRVTGAVWPSLLTAALFAVHPMNVESVAWVSERKGLISTFFGILTLWAYVRYAEQPALRRYWLVLVSLALGLMAKSMLVTLPFVLLLLDFWPLRRWRVQPALEPQPSSVDQEVAPFLIPAPATGGRLIAEKLPLLVLAAGCSVVAVIAQRYVGALPSLESVPLDARVSNAVVSYVIYLVRAVYPVQLSAFYPLPQGVRPWWEVWGAAGLLLVITGIVVGSARRVPYLAVGWFWYLGTLFPVIGLVQVGGHAQADRYCYLPFVGLFVAVSWGLADFARHWRCEWLAAGLAGTIVACFGMLSWAQVEHWQNGFALWQQAIRVTGGSSRAYFNLGVLWLEQEEYAEARECFQKALEFEPDSTQTWHNLGLALLGLTDYSAAANHFRKVLHRAPNDVKAHAALGLALLRQGEYPEAALHFHEVVRMSPDSAESSNNLGLTYQLLEQWQEAIRWHRRAVALDPQNATYRRDLAVALERAWRR